MNEEFLRDFFHMPRAKSAPIKKIDNVSLRGPINGMGEADMRGDYYRMAVTMEDDEFLRGRLTRGQMEELRDQLNHFLKK